MSISGNTEGHAGQGSEQLSLVGEVPAHCSGWTGWPLKVPSSQNCSMIL